MPESPVGLRAVVGAEDAGLLGKIFEEGSQRIAPATHPFQGISQVIRFRPVEPVFESTAGLGVEVVLGHLISEVP